MTESRADVLHRVREWHRGLPSPAPSWGDVEVVVRLGVRDTSVLRQLLLGDIELVENNWQSLQGVLAPTPDPTSSAGAHAGDARPDTPGEDQVAQRPGPSLGPRAGARFRALTEWVAGALAEGREVDAVTDAQLVAIAEADAPGKEIHKTPQLRGFRAQLEQLLQRAGEAEPADDAPAPPTTPQATPRASTPSPAAPAAPSADATPVPSQPAVPTTAPGQVRSGPVAVEPFAPYDWGQAPEHPPTPARVVVSATDSESLHLTWPRPATDGLVRIYRVVTNDTYAPQSPEMGDLVAATYDGEATDAKEFVSPVRHVTVWVNTGTTEEEARGAQPELHAEAVTVLPIRGLEVSNEQGTVLGQWRAIEGLSRVDVFRIPIEVALANPHAYRVGDRLEAQAISQGGFKDTGATPGAEYEYRVFAVATVSDADVFAPPVSERVRLDTVVQAVTDLTATQREDSDNYDLSFTYPPQGKVEIYRRAVEPPGGIGATIRTRDALVRNGFSREFLLPQPIDHDGERGWVRDVAWPSGWSRAYFSPVTVLDESHTQVGTHVILTRATPVSHVRLVERVDEQFLTFAWPSGVALVKIFQGPTGTAFVDPDQMALHEIHEDEYRRLGGAHLRHPLPPEGCAVHLVATSFTKGLPRYADPVTVEYPGLIRVDYQVQPAQVPGRKRGEAPSVSTLRTVLVRSNATSPPGLGIRVALVHNSHRLPLHIGDGEELATRMIGFTKDQPVEFVQVDLAGRSGFVRVFVDVPQGLRQSLAVLDPPIAALRCP